jgi:hypothetical protein
MFTALAAALLSLQAAAANLSGTKTISLVGADGERLAIGREQFSAEGNAQRFAVAFDDAPFDNYFLAIRPFNVSRIRCSMSAISRTG